MLNKVILERVLKSREDRRLKQEDIISRYPFSLISFTLNTPGVIKDSPLYRRIHNEGIIEIEKMLKDINTDIIYKTIIYKRTGSEGFISVDVDPKQLKVLCTKIEENHLLGRIFDIDIFNSNYSQINRTHINKETRQCLICEERALNCIRSKRHTTEELIEKIQNISRGYFR